MASQNLAARAGRWSARHRKIAIFGWLAFVMIALVGGGAAGLNTFAWQENGPGEAGRADKAIFDHFPRHAEETVLVQTASGTTRDPAFRDAVTDVQRRLERTAYVEHVKSRSRPGTRARSRVTTARRSSASSSPATSTSSRTASTRP